VSETTEPSLELTLAYDGTEFHGWQAQPACRTVEGDVRAALERLLGAPPVLHGASRTDQGVHALGQAVSLHGALRIPAARLVPALNGSLPLDIRAVRASERTPGFHARFSAVGKHYRYMVDAGEVPNVLLRRYAHHLPVAIDLGRLIEASRHFIGEWDFISYQCESGQVRESTVRTIFEVRAARRGDLLAVDVWGDGFLYKMVRTMVGTLLEVGRGRWQPDHVRESLAARDRRQAGPTLPAHGLCLMAVYFEASELHASHRAPPLPAPWSEGLH